MQDLLEISQFGKKMGEGRKRWRRGSACFFYLFLLLTSLSAGNRINKAFKTPLGGGDVLPTRLIFIVWRKMQIPLL